MDKFIEYVSKKKSRIEKLRDMNDRHEQKIIKICQDRHYFRDSRRKYDRCIVLIIKKRHRWAYYCGALKIIERFETLTGIMPRMKARFEVMGGNQNVYEEEHYLDERPPYSNQISEAWEVYPKIVWE